MKHNTYSTEQRREAQIKGTQRNKAAAAPTAMKRNDKKIHYYPH